MGDIGLTTMSPTNSSVVNPSDATQGSSLGLAVGLSVFFLLLVLIAVPVIFYLKRSHSSVWRLDRTRSVKKEDDDVRIDQQRAAPHQYSPMGRVPCDAGPSPIYENYSGLPKTSSSSGGGPMSPSLPEEDLYLQCDTTDDAIYGNDPNCSLAMLPEAEDGEDPYIIPDAL